MFKHVFDMNETATRALAAERLRALADQIAEGTLDLSPDEYETPTPVRGPMDLTVDLQRDRRRAELALQLRWPLEKPADAA